MKLRLLLLLTVLAALLGLAGCGSKAKTEDESLYDLIIEDDSSSAVTTAETTQVTSDTTTTTAAPETTAAVQTTSAEVTTTSEVQEEQEYTEYWFRTRNLRDQHYEKHGIEMGFDNADDHRRAASDVVNDPAALHKTEKEDGDDVYYLEDTNEFVVVSKDGFLRTYFCPDKGKAYFDKQ